MRRVSEESMPRSGLQDRLPWAKKPPPGVLCLFAAKLVPKPFAHADAPCLYFTTATTTTNYTSIHTYVYTWTSAYGMMHGERERERAQRRRVGAVGRASPGHGMTGLLSDASTSAGAYQCLWTRGADERWVVCRRVLDGY